MKNEKKIKTSKNFFYYVCGIGVLVCILIYLIPFRMLVNKTSEIETENSILETNLVLWREYFENMDTYIENTNEIKESIEETLQVYPSDVREEDIVMLAVTLQEDTSARVSNINIADKEDVYSIDSETTLATGIEDFTGELDWKDLTASYVINCDYDSIKDCVKAIYDEENNIGIKSITVSKNDDESLIGSIDVAFYFLEGTTKEYVKPNIPTYIKGTDNIFGVISIASESEETEDGENDKESVESTE